MLRPAGLTLLCFFAFLCAPLHCFAQNQLKFEDPYPLESRALTDWLRAQRLVEDRQALEELSEAGAARGALTAQSAETAVPETSALLDALPPGAETLSIAAWFEGAQAESPVNLVESYRENAALDGQGFTYDQALAGLVMLAEENWDGAAAIFDFFEAEWDGSGLWTVYNTLSPDGGKVEWLRLLGPNAWAGIFSARYYELTGQTRARDLAVKIGKWIASLPHENGGIAMGAENSGTHPNWGRLFSVENNLDAYALLSYLADAADREDDRQLFEEERSALAVWFETKAFDPATGLFRRGIGDDFASFDTNTWAVLVFGAEGLAAMGVDAAELMGLAEQAFLVQADGSFGGDPLTAAGFDFSNAWNASLAGREGLRWVEGTFHAALVYSVLAETSHEDASAFLALRGHFIDQNEAESAVQDGAKGYRYTSAPGVQIYGDNPTWTTADGFSAASTAWAYFAKRGINPFVILEPEPAAEIAPFDAGYRLGPQAPETLKVSVDADGRAAVTFEGRAHEGVFEPTTGSVRVDGIADLEGVASETWRLSFGPGSDGEDAWSALNLFEREVLEDDGDFYHTLHAYDADGEPFALDFRQSLADGHEIETRQDWAYTEAAGMDLVAAARTETSFDGAFGYETLSEYAYDALGDLLSIRITEETRREGRRFLRRYELAFLSSGETQLVDLGVETLPL